MANVTDRTYIEYVKDPDKVIPPNRNLVLIGLCVEDSGGYIAFTLLGDPPLNFGHGSAIKTSVSGPLNLHITLWLT